MNNSNSPQFGHSPHVRGSSVYIQALKPYRALAIVFDLGLGAVLFFSIFLVSRSVPMLTISQGVALILLAVILWLIQRFACGVTLGERLWGLRTQDRMRLNPSLLQSYPISPTTQSLGIFLTLLSFIVALSIAYSAIVLHPIGMPTRTLAWEAFFPSEDEAPAMSNASAPTSGQDRWTIIPFYYSLGAWPKSFRGNDVFYTLPYAKGPPERFAGQIVARWNHPQIRVTIEGPKSPVQTDGTPYERAEIQQCLLNMWELGWLALPHCLHIRSAVLDRHIEALKSMRPTTWELGWVQVENRALQDDERLQGVLMSARGEKRGQDRFILITARGTHQAFILDYPLNESGEMARETFRNTLRSLRVSDDLNPGRAWVDQAIQKVNLREVSTSGQSEAAVRRLAEVQALLVSRISVDPKNYDTYFHLGGTSMMIARYAEKLRKFPPPEGNPERATKLIEVAKPMIQTAQRYAEDVAPKDKRNKILGNLAAEAQKL